MSVCQCGVLLQVVSKVLGTVGVTGSLNATIAGRVAMARVFPQECVN